MGITLLLGVATASTSGFHTREVAAWDSADTTGSPRFGYAVALDGPIALVATPWDGDGKVDAFHLQPDGSWFREARFAPGDLDGGDFGRSLDLDGDRAVVGAPFEADHGSAHVYERQADGTWERIARIAAPAPDERFGAAVALHGDVAVVGAWGADDGARDAGAAYVFERSEHGTWDQVARLTPPNPGRFHSFGWSAALDGDRLIVGQSSSGAVVFERDAAGAWVAAAELHEVGAQHYGRSVDLRGDLAVVGAQATYLDGELRGTAYVYERGGDGVWSRVATLSAEGSTEGAFFGSAVAVDGDFVAVGARNEGLDGEEAGGAYLFARQPDGAWAQADRLQRSLIEPHDWFGAAVTIAGKSVLVGAPEDNSLGNAWGKAFLFEVRANLPPVSVIASVPVQECTDLGAEVALDGTGSSDPDGDPLTFAWSAPGVTFDDPASATPTGTFPLGTTTATLTVSDDFGSTDAAQVEVVVQDTLPPTAGFLHPRPSTVYVLDAPVVGSNDPRVQWGSMAFGALTIQADAQDQCGGVVVDFVLSTGVQHHDDEAPFEVASDPPLGAPVHVMVDVVATDAVGFTASASTSFDQMGVLP